MTNRPSTDTTEDLIRRLAASSPPPRLTAGAAAAPILTGLVLTVGLFLLLAGPRADLAEAMATPEVAAKMLLPLVLAVLALALALRSARPAGVFRPRLLVIPVAAALALFAVHLVQTSPARIVPGILGHSAAACLLSITALSAPAIAAGLAIFRRGASLRPALTGGLIGMAASAGAAAGYALYCTEDSPLFFTIWYGLAILICTGIGALAGRRLLRW